ncbi:carboxylic ester hydrolase [Sphingobium jiangsuense]|uniref:Carboxylic ester hydrolase n=1 Tax=Sphingobium jiangsuense TaxID=870476 RepID=A0A7W6BGV5_9SPHN|nr:carboxylesterase family protein [Sphingobium jiangsuense]MBB3926750.1 para-nitrobenzyl esterase [Sphingobium jiangsuense]GLS99440.1 carboxylic ester hydrolase [Sphingobium jiangsuense]
MHRREFLFASALGLGGLGAGNSWAGAGKPIGAGQGTGHPVVRTSEGLARGYGDGGVSVFKGLRYGAATGGAGRFRRSRPPERWRGIRDFHAYGESAPQLANRDPQIGLPAVEPDLWASFTSPAAQGEDCLRLNIWTPSARPEAQRPVLVWIHGGGFREGSGGSNATDGRLLAASNDVVVVTLNHRLGVFGFLSLDHFDASYADSGNVGMLDIVDALKWIRANIRNFGGDPDRVTVFGESGGGAKVSTLLAMPEAVGLFARAICQSGVLIWGEEREAARKAADAVLDHAGIRPGDVEALAALPTAKLLASVNALGPAVARQFMPVIGGSLPTHPFADGAPDISAHIPLIIGTSRDEARNLVGSPAMFALDWESLPRTLQKMFSIDPAGIVSGYRALYPEYSPSDIFFAVMSQFLIIRSAIHAAEARARQAGARTWVYSLEWPTPVAGGRFGAPHSLSVPLVFGTMEAVPSMVPANAESVALSGLMRELWTSFAAEGQPRSSQIEWPLYFAPARRTLALDAPPAVRGNLRAAERRILADLPWFDTNGGHRPPPADAAA